MGTVDGCTFTVHPLQQKQLNMKLLVVLSVIAYGYAAKLDRTYLPPVNAATAGGSPGALTTPIQSGSNIQQGSSSIYQQGPADSGIQPGNSGFQSGSTGFIQGTGIQTGPNGFTSNNGAVIGDGNGNSATPITSYGPAFESSGQTGFVPSQIGSKSGNGQGEGAYNQNQGFVQGGSGQIAQAYTPERAQAAAERNAEILRFVNENNIDSYSYSYETSNGIAVEENGEASNGVRAQGAYSYIGDDGQTYSITYTADENGYQPQGEHLPTPHPIPEEILRSIEQNARAAAAGTQEGAYRPEEYESGSQQQYSGDLGLNRPVDQNVGVFKGNQGEILKQPLNDQYYTSLDKSNQGFVNGQSGLFNQGLSGNQNAQSGYDYSQTSQRQGQVNNGFKQNQGQNVFGTTGQEFLGQNDQQQTGYSQLGSSGSKINNYQGASGSKSGNEPSIGGQPQYQARVTQSNTQSGYQAKGQDQNNRGQSPFGTQPNIQASYQFTQGSQNKDGNQQSETNGYQYQPNTNKNTFAVRPTQSGSQRTGQNTLNKGQSPFETQYNTQASYQYTQGPQNNNDNRQYESGSSSQGYQYQPNANQNAYGVSGSNTQSGNQVSGQNFLNKGQSPFGTQPATQGYQTQTSQNQGGNQQSGSNVPSGQGYQYQSNQNTFGLNGANQGNNGFIVGADNQNQYTKQPSFGPNTGSGQTSFIGGNQNAQISVQRGNQPISGAKGQGFNGGSQTLQAPYEYSRPDQTSGDQNAGTNGFINIKGNQGSDQFGGPRQPPSFSPQEGYKY